MLRYQYNIGSLLNQLYVSGFLKPEKGAFAAKFHPFTARNLANRPGRGIISPRRKVMRRNSGAIRMVFTGIFILTTVLFYAGCTDMYGVADFENQTSFPISVTIVGSKFQYQSSEYVQFKSPSGNGFTVPPKGNVEISTRDSAINFKWTTGDFNNNSKIYVVQDEGKAIFKE
jgi:hypothetical protein